MMRTPSSRRLRGRRKKDRESDAKLGDGTKQEVATGASSEPPDPEIQQLRSRLELLYWAWGRTLALVLATAYVLYAIVRLIEGHPVEEALFGQISHLIETVRGDDP